ncbi:hypothetical protein [Kluyvera chengduensis]|uniref:hypothetical protein n=1 Tax=Kluyvera sp. 142359 TaxID=3375726 RepID=UPI00377403BA
MVDETQQLTASELTRLIWGLKAEGFHVRLLAGLIELQQRREADEQEHLKAQKLGAVEALVKVRAVGLAMGTLAGINDPAAGKALYEMVSNIVDQVSIGYQEINK